MKRKYSIDDSYFKNIQHIQAWLLGILAADGCICKNTITISQSGKEGLKIITYIKKITNFKGNILITQPKKGNIVYTLAIRSAEIIEDLKKYNIVPRKSLSYKLPILDDSIFYSFLRGYIDGDGCVGIYDNGLNAKYLQISLVGTKNFIDNICKKIPIAAGILKKTENNVYEARWYGKKAKTIGSLVYSNNTIFKGKKYNIYLEATKLKNRDTIYSKKMEDVRNLLSLNIPAMEISKKVNIAFQTVYKWKKNWKL